MFHRFHRSPVSERPLAKVLESSVISGLRWRSFPWGSNEDPEWGLLIIRILGGNLENGREPIRTIFFLSFLFLKLPGPPVRTEMIPVYQSGSESGQNPVMVHQISNILYGSSNFHCNTGNCHDNLSLANSHQFIQLSSIKFLTLLDDKASSQQHGPTTELLKSQILSILDIFCRKIGQIWKSGQILGRPSAILTEPLAGCPDKMCFFRNWHHWSGTITRGPLK